MTSRRLSPADEEGLRKLYEGGAPWDEIEGWLAGRGYSHTRRSVANHASGSGWERGGLPRWPAGALKWVEAHYRHIADGRMAEYVTSEFGYPATRDTVAKIRMSRGWRKPIPSVATERFTKAPRINENVACLLDVHTPYHDAAWIDRVCNLASAWGVTVAVMDTDAIDLDWLSRFERDPQSTAQREIKAWHDLTDVLCETFKVVWIHAANHGLRIKRTVRGMSKEQQELLAVLPGGDDPVTALFAHRPEIKMTDYSYCFVRGVMVGHPSATGKGTGEYLMESHECDCVIGHTHYRGTTWSRSDKHVAYEVGMCADPAKLRYASARLPARARGKQRQGAAIIMKGLDGETHIYGLTPRDDFEAKKRMYG